MTFEGFEKQVDDFLRNNTSAVSLVRRSGFHDFRIVAGQGHLFLQVCNRNLEGECRHPVMLWGKVTERPEYVAAYFLYCLEKLASPNSTRILNFVAWRDAHPL